MLLTLFTSYSTIGDQQCTPTLLISYSVRGNPHSSCLFYTVSICPYTIYRDQQCTPTLFVPYSTIGDLQCAYTVGFLYNYREQTVYPYTVRLLWYMGECIETMYFCTHPVHTTQHASHQCLLQLTEVLSNHHSWIERNPSESTHQEERQLQVSQ